MARYSRLAEYSKELELQRDIREADLKGRFDDYITRKKYFCNRWQDISKSIIG